MSEDSKEKSSDLVLGRTRFETVLTVRPDDIDMNQHVHASKYLDYVLAARYDQMERCYQMSMDEFLKQGFGWYVKTCHANYKRSLKMGERFVVRTWIDEFIRRGVKVQFEIDRETDGKRIADGYFDYSMIDLNTGRAAVIPAWIARKYAV